MPYEIQNLIGVGYELVPKRACAKTAGEARLSYNHDYLILREAIDLILRAAQLSPQFGLPLRALAYRYDLVNLGIPFDSIAFECSPAVYF